MYKYHFDGYLNGRACGWILDLDQPNQPVPLGLYAEGKLIQSALADLFREDIRDAGIGDGCCGFQIPVDIASQFEIEIRVLTDGMPIAGSCKSFLTIDEYVNKVLRSRHFDDYVQFKPENLATSAAPRRFARKSTRLSRAFSKVVGKHEGVAYTAHMEWMCARMRRGVPSFFSQLRRQTLDDLYWYLFECNDATKALADYNFDYLSRPVFADFPGMEHHTVLFDIWLHRVGRRLGDLRKDGGQAHIEFCHALIAANTTCPRNIRAELESECRLSKVFGTLDPTGGLPHITNYLKTKWERGYQHLYRFEDLNGYILFLFDCCLHADNAREIELYGSSVLNFFRTAIALPGGHCSRFSLICYALAAKASSQQGAGFSQITALQVNAWFGEVWLAAHPLHRVFQAPADSKSRAENATPACFVVAHWNSPSGLTQNAHMSVKALTAAGMAVVMLMPNGDVFGRKAPSSESGAIRLKKNVVLLHVNADDAPSALFGVAEQVQLDRAHVVGFFLWELEVVPDSHRLGVQLVDEIWVPTEFVAGAYRGMGASNVHWVGKAIAVPSFAKPERSRFGMEARATVFLTSFDFHSSIERKNPLATVLAFRKAFPDRSDVQLVLKSTHPPQSHWGDPFDQWGQISDIAAVDPRITVIDEFLSDDEMFEMIACADVIVSSHRAEGFGYIPAYGLLYGKQVIATGYGGTSDYCDAQNASLVGFDLVKLPNDRFVYPVPEAKWAEVDVLALTQCLEAAINTTTKAKVRKQRGAMVKGLPVKDYFAYSGLTARYMERLQAAGVLVS